MKAKALSLTQVPAQLVTSIILGGLIYYFGRYYLAAIPFAIALVFELYRLGRQPAETWSDLLIEESPIWLVTLSTALLVALLPRLATQLALVLALVAWRVWIELGTVRPIAQMALAGVAQFAALWAIFLAESVWHWPTILVMVLVWGVSWVVARFALSAYDDKAVSVLAVTWGLLVSELAWIFSLWQVQYILLNGWVIVPQAAIVLTALGYCLGGIYISHRRSQLSRSRLIEYLMIGLVLLAIVIAGTKWNGVI